MMKRLICYGLGLLSVFFFLNPVVSAQTFISGITSAGDTSNMPDLEQPETLTVNLCPPGPGIPPGLWPNYCAPVSAANIWEYYDNMIPGMNMAPWVGDWPTPPGAACPPPPYIRGTSFSTATIQGEGSAPPALPVHMDTNDMTGGGTYSGTTIFNMWSGVQSYASTAESAGGSTKGSYTAPFQLDERIAWVAVAPPQVNLIPEIGAWANYTSAIDNGTPTIVCFLSWVDLTSVHTNGGIEYYGAWGPAGSGDTGGVDESWRTDESGHAVTGVGYRVNFDPDAGGPIPSATWYITRDNWMSTGTEVAVALGSGNWQCTLYIGEPVEIQEPTPTPAPGLEEIDFSVDTDSPKPRGVGGSAVNAEDTLPEDSEDDFYLSILLGSNTKTMDENVPAAGGPIVPALSIGTGNGENTDAYCFGTNVYIGEIPGEFYFDEVDQEVQNGSLWIQFTVNTNSVGLPGTGVNAQQPAEEGGDVFQSMPGLLNIQLVDETQAGLLQSQEDDMNSLVIPDEYRLGSTPPFAALPLNVDTNGNGTPDSPTVYFSVKNGGTTPTALSGDVIYQTPPWAGGVRTSLISWTAMNLGLPGSGVDEIDALYVEDPLGQSGGPWVYFSLAALSQSLLASPTTILNPFWGVGVYGCDPGDIIGVQPSVAAPTLFPLAAPTAGPQVVIQAGTLGLVGNKAADNGLTDDDLNGLHVTQLSLQISGWEIY